VLKEKAKDARPFNAPEGMVTMKGKFKISLTMVPLLMVVGLVCFYYFFPGTMFDFLVNLERSAGGLEKRTVIVDGLRIEYLEGGKGDALVLLHGFGADKDNWTRFGKYFTKQFRVIAPDLPGFGESSADADLDYTISAQASRVKAFIAALGIKTMHLGGSSMGGHIAGVYASKYPQDLKSLILIAPAGIAAAEPSELDRQLKEGKLNPLIAKSTDGFDHLLNFVFHERPFIPGAVKKHLMQTAIERQPLNTAIFKQFYKNWDTPPLEVLMKGLPTPTLIVWGSNDRVLHVSGANILEAALPRSQVAVMDHVGHLPMIEKPKETADLYLAFLER